ncbi:MAG: hypothetical protein AB7O04_05505 [Hyphomonadaceae bacterium]
MAALAILFDKRQRAVARAKFRAWWDGVEFDEAALDAEAEAAPEAPANDAQADDLFEAAPEDLPSRLAALARLWGDGRLMPGDEAAEALLLAQIGAAEDGVIAVLGAGMPAPLLALAAKHPGKIVALEWRDETRANLTSALARAKLSDRVSVHTLDLDAYAAPTDAFDGLISFDEFTYTPNAPRLAVQIAKALKPGACALIESYCAIPAPALAPAFAASFAEAHVRPAGDLAEVLTEAGLAVEANEDQTADHLLLARQGFKRLEGVLAAAVEQGMDLSVMREIAWEAEAWRARMKALSQKRLERRQILARKPAA